MYVNQRRNTQSIDFQVVIRKLVTLDALQPEYNVSEIIVKASLALILMLYVSKSRHALGRANCMNVHFFLRKSVQKEPNKTYFLKNYFKFVQLVKLFLVCMDCSAFGHEVPYHDHVISALFFIVG